MCCVSKFFIKQKFTFFSLNYLNILPIYLKEIEGFKMSNNKVEIESPEKLTEMLYEGVLRFNAEAKTSIEKKDVEKKAYWINRSIAIIRELISSLDMEQEGDVSSYLNGLYNYQIQLLSEAENEDNIAKLNECSNVFRTLLEVWKESTDVA